MSVRRIGLGTSLAATMAAATFVPAVFSILAVPLRSEFSVARWRIGVLVTVVMAVGALLSPISGTWADRLEPRVSNAFTLVLAGLSFLVMGLAPGYWTLAGGASIAGVAQAMCNPATNRLIMSHAGVGRRGFLTGLKQAGVQAGNFLGGILLPIGAASAMGWRGTVSLVAVAPVIGLVALAVAAGRGEAPIAVPVTSTLTKSPPEVVRIAVYAALLGLAAGSLFTYLPSYAQEGFGMSTEVGGLLVSVFGAVGFVTRLTVGHVSERYFGHQRTLVSMALMTSLAGILMAVAPNGGWLWLAAVLIGIGPMAWNVVANVAVMELAPEGSAGRGSGVMMAGFLGGMAVGAPLYGASVDLVGSYRPGWLVVVVLGGAAAWVAAGIGPKQLISQH